MNVVAVPVISAVLSTDRLGLHLLLAFGLLLMFIAVVGAMRRAWRARATAQEDDLRDLPYPPEQPGTVIAAPLRGMYLGTVDAGHWLEWIAARGLGGRDGGYVTVYETGVQVDRYGEAFWIPREAVRGARLERAHAGKVAAPGRLIVVAWSFAGRELETGFRGEDRARQPKVVRAVHDLIGPPAFPTDGEVTSPRPVARTLARLRPRPGDETGGMARPAAAAPPARGEGGSGGRRIMPRSGRATSPPPPAAPAPRPPAGRPGLPVGDAGRGPGQPAVAPRPAQPGRTPGQSIADRRGVDPYGSTGPQVAWPAEADPYRAGPHPPVPPRTGVPPGPAPVPGPGGQRGTGQYPVAGPRGGGVPPGPPVTRMTGQYRVGDPYATPDPYATADPYQTGPYGGRPRDGSPPGPGHGGADPGWPGSGAPAATPPAADPDAPQDRSAVDPLTSPLGEVVRRLHRDR
jgi:carbamoyl-phosphate synthase small subunit